MARDIIEQEHDIVNLHPELSDEEIDYWEERSHEQLRFEACSPEVSEEYNRTHPMPTEEEIERILKDAVA